MNAERIHAAKITNYHIGAAINALNKAYNDATGLGDNDAVRELRIEIAQIMGQLEDIEGVLNTVTEEASE